MNQNATVASLFAGRILIRLVEFESVSVLSSLQNRKLPDFTQCLFEMPFPEEEEKAVVVGICAMEKKSHSRPMRQIVLRLEEFDRHIKVFQYTFSYGGHDYCLVNPSISP